MTERSLAGTHKQLVFTLCGSGNPDEADGRRVSESEKTERTNVEIERPRELETGERGGWGWFDYYSFWRINQLVAELAMGQTQLRTVQDPLSTAAEIK